MAFPRGLASALLAVLLVSPIADAPAGEVEKSAPMEYSIGAYYFGIWDSQFPRPQIEHYREWYGRAGDWWAGVRDLHDSPRERAAEFEGDFRHLKPQIGYYDVSNPETMRKHILQAKRGGLNFFDFYIYWDRAVNEEKFGGGLNAFTSLRGDPEFKFMLAIVADGVNSGVDQRSFEKLSEYLVSRYLQSETYLRDADGHLLVEILDARGIGSGSAEDVDQFIGKLRATAVKHGIGPLDILVSSNVEIFPMIHGIDGLTCSDHFYFPEGAEIKVKSYSSYLRNFDGYFDQIKKFDRRRLPFLYCVSSGHDERPRIYLNTQVKSLESHDHIRRLLPWYYDSSPLNFRNALILAKARMDRGESKLSRYLVVYAWNEWNEGGTIEPSEFEGSEYLDAVKEVFR